MRQFTLEELQTRRDTSYHRRPELAVQGEEAARAFVDKVGFCFLFPVPGVELPSLWEAVNGGSRPIPHHHYDRALHWTWRWKDTLPSKKQVFYAKLLRQKPTLVSLKAFPYFYALSENYGELEDYLDSYYDGKLSEEARRIYEVLLARGACATGVLRREAGLWGRENSTRFDRAIGELQREMKITKCGISDANRWKYSYVYEILARWLPDQVREGVAMGSRQATEALLLCYLRTVVASTPTHIASLFAWKPENTVSILEALRRLEAVVEASVNGVEGFLALSS